MQFHPVYINAVLEPEYSFVSTHLKPYFVDALTAHAKTVRRLEHPEVKLRQAEIASLEQALIDLHKVAAPSYDPEIPDLFYALNRRLERLLGPAPVSFLRLGLSRNDLDMTVYRMRARDLLLELATSLSVLQRALLVQAETHVHTVLIAYTHHQPGQPTSLAHYLLAVAFGLGRTAKKLLGVYETLNECPMGAAALAGSSPPLDRAFTATCLGFAAPLANTYDAVASSDWQVEIVGLAQQASLLLSRFVHDLLLWSGEGSFRLVDGLTQGSSIMPQKRNPVALEHARSRFSRVLGTAQAVLLSSHNIPFGDQLDSSPDVQSTLQLLFGQLGEALSLLSASLEHGSFDTEQLAQRARATDTTATELANELVASGGLNFQDAHRLSAELAAALHASARPWQSLTPADLTALGGPLLPAETLARAVSPEAFVARRSGLGGPSPGALEVQITQLYSELESQEAWSSETRKTLDHTTVTLRKVVK